MARSRAVFSIFTFYAVESDWLAGVVGFELRESIRI